MKKFGLFVLSFVLVLSLAACGCQRSDVKPTETMPPTTPPTQPSTVPTTMPTIPEMDPTLETNIPDPDINTTIPDNEIMDNETIETTTP